MPSPDKGVGALRVLGAIVLFPLLQSDLALMKGTSRASEMPAPFKGVGALRVLGAIVLFPLLQPGLALMKGASRASEMPAPDKGVGIDFGAGMPLNHQTHVGCRHLQQHHNAFCAHILEDAGVGLHLTVGLDFVEEGHHRPPLLRALVTLT
ncbi:hypothetical protein NDU88_006231 [Pleurodeles waltl]|uniref:Uncharacterized protein n=1 Tax=Pleurodeles waltl TaxID=8319 RepID=A0AAV7NQ58_PLEWA|nr:hypothetical protein NDU88_006231 [Pleurodeles waltl]